MTGSLSAPIIVADGDDATFYPSLHAAVSAPEGVDVEDGIYKVFDAVGRRFDSSRRECAVDASSWTSALFTSMTSETEPSGATELRALLARYARFRGIAVHESDDLPALIRAVT